MTVGTKNMVAWGLEAAFGTAPANTTNALSWPVRTERPGIRVETANDEDTLTGVQETGSESLPVRRWIEMSGVEFDARFSNIAYWLHKVLGGISSTGSNDPYTHTITNNGAEKPSVTAFWYDPLVTATKIETFAGLKVQRLTLRSQVGGKVTIAVDLIGKGGDDPSGAVELVASMPAIVRDAPLTHSMISAFTMGGVDLKSLLQEFELVIEPQYSINDEYGAGSLYINSLECSGLNITCRVGLNYGAAPKALINSVLAQTGSPVVLTLAKDTYSATINLYNVFLEDGNPTGQRAKLKQSLNGRAYYSVSDSKAIQATVINGLPGTKYTT